MFIRDLETMKQGIVSVLEYDENKKSSSSSIRRTLSADMSSDKWLTKHGLTSSSPIEKISSSLELISLLSITDVEAETESNESSPTQFDIWSSIISKKVEEGDNNDKDNSPAYIHPLVKRSASSLSEKSLEICTESLGSETGSDGFSSETGDAEEDKKNDKVVVANTILPQLQQQQKSFPPPIPSLLRTEGGGGTAALRIMSHRNNGRLVLQAVPLPQQNHNFNAQREGGRLVLTFASKEEIIEEKEVEFEEEIDNFECEIDDEEEETEETEYSVFKQGPKNLNGGIINVLRLALMVNNKSLGLPNRNQTWSNKFDEKTQSLPPRPSRLIPSSPSAAASLNTYEYYCRPKPMTDRSKNDDKNKLDEQLVILNGKNGDYLTKGCKETRSLLFWGPHCVATT